MKFLKEMWSEIRPQTKEEKRELLKDLGKLCLILIVCGAIIYFGCL